MKKLRIAALIVLALCFALVLVACGNAKERSIKSTFKTVAADKALPTLAAATKLDVAGNSVQTRGALVLFSDGTVQTVYNVALNSKVGTFTDSATETYDVDLRSTDAPGYDIAFFVVTKATAGATEVTYQTTLYAADGTTVASADKAVFDLDYEFDLVLFNGKCYRVAEDGAMTEAFAWSEMAGDLPDIFAASKKYYYAELDVGSGFAVLDRSLKTVSWYKFPAHAITPVYGVLSNGDVWLQYAELLPEAAEKFDYMTNGAGNTVIKYNLVQQVMDAKKGSLKDVKTDYYLNGGMVARNILPAEKETFDALKGSIDTLATGYKIVDQRISTGMADFLILSISNSGKVESVLNRAVDGQVGMPQAVADDVVLISDVLGHEYLYNAKGKLIGDVTGAVAMTDTYVVGEGKIYNFQLNEVYDFAKEGYEYEGALKSAVLFSKEVGGVQQNYLFKDGAMTAVANSGNSQVLNERLFVVVDNTTGKYFYYNDAGTMILQADIALTNVTDTGEDAYLIRATVDGNLGYYRLG